MRKRQNSLEVKNPIFELLNRSHAIFAGSILIKTRQHEKIRLEFWIKWKQKNDGKIHLNLTFKINDVHQNWTKQDNHFEILEKENKKNDDQIHWNLPWGKLFDKNKYLLPNINWKIITTQAVRELYLDLHLIMKNKFENWWIKLSINVRKSFNQKCKILK